MAFWHCVGFMSDRSSKMMMMIAIECVALYQISKIIFIPLGWVWLMECCCWSKRLVLEVVGKCAVQTITGIHSSLYRWLTWSQITGIFEKSTNFVNYHYYLLIALACMHRPQIKSNESKSRFDRKSFSFFFRIGVNVWRSNVKEKLPYNFSFYFVSAGFIGFANITHLHRCRVASINRSRQQHSPYSLHFDASISL